MNVVFADDGTIRKGYKNRRFRCQGSPNFFGGHKCDGCQKTVCVDPKENLLDRTDGYCGRANNPLHNEWN